MADRFQYAQVRQKIIDALKTDILGPGSPDEVLDENPRHAYIVGMLMPRTAEGSSSEQEVEADAAYGDEKNFTADSEDDNAPASSGKFQIPSSIGISFYVDSCVSAINVETSWGDYTKSTETAKKADGTEFQKALYNRHAMTETTRVDFNDFDRSKEYDLACDSNVQLHITKSPLKRKYLLVTAYIVNKRKNASNDLELAMFQVRLKVSSVDGANVFVAEHICREILAKDEFYFEQRPILGRGRGCAASWGEPIDGRASFVQSEFVPQYEFPGVSAVLQGLDASYFSMRQMAQKAKRNEIIEKLRTLAGSYEEWIQTTLCNSPKMADVGFRNNIGNEIIQKCQSACRRIHEGINLIQNDDTAFEAFCFMNRCMLLQRNISSYSRKYGAGIECKFADFVDPRKPENEFAWRPFQIAFILMNLSAIVNPTHQDREIVDLLYFPTGGGKTEAYLGLMAFAIANRRLHASDDGEFNRDGGVTAILRYTLRLLTTQQRDRITKMVIAAEMIREKTPDLFGKTRISIGFWVGGGVTPNKFKDLVEDPGKPGEARHQRNLIFKQLLTCPFCGKPLKEENFSIDVDRKSVEIYCSDPHCVFYKYRPNVKPIPVYLVDEEIYAKCPTIILSTVDKFARLPWDVNTNALFGRIDRFCSRDGYVAKGAAHKKHNKTERLPGADVVGVRPFLPPELIIQDELHLITGPLGTIYGAYETIIENMCEYQLNGAVIKPKYIVSTATIKNAEEQSRCLYARGETSQFPPTGFEIGDSFFIKEKPVSEDPFRMYVGICAPGQSMKTALLRIYSIILQEAYSLSLQDAFKGIIDPYYTLIGYYNSIRELGGAVRLLQDDIPSRIKRLKKRYGTDRMRFLNRNVEITSRMPSYKIPEQLRKLETKCNEPECLDTAIATNMIAVGMDVDRLGLMVVTGQPKQNSEYIQATSRIGRSYPGLVVTLYNPYRPRDLSHYENFTGYHSQLYRFVEGTTATPFSARARDRVLHGLIIAAVRLKFPDFAENEAACKIQDLTDEQRTEIKAAILDRLNIIKPEARNDAEAEIEQFMDDWSIFASQKKQLRYYVLSTEKYNRLMNYYGEPCSSSEKATLTSMREVESAANMYYLED